MSTPDTPEAAARPVLRIISGNPDPAEIAAVTVALFAIDGGEPESAPVPPVTGGWGDNAARLRRSGQAARGGWRASARW